VEVDNSGSVGVGVGPVVLVAAVAGVVAAVRIRRTTMQNPTVVVEEAVVERVAAAADTWRQAAVGVAQALEVPVVVSAEVVSMIRCPPRRTRRMAAVKRAGSREVAGELAAEKAALAGAVRSNRRTTKKRVAARRAVASVPEAVVVAGAAPGPALPVRGS
jgi:hypothetical protein